MSRIKEVIEEINHRVGEASTADGFLMTLTTRKDEKLEHFEAHVNFRDNDIELSLNKVKLLALGTDKKIRPLTFRNYKTK